MIRAEDSAGLPPIELGESSFYRWASPGSSGGSIGLGFAIPIELARTLAGELIASGEVSHPSFGMQVQTISQELARATGGTAGLFVQSVPAVGPAWDAGLRPGDIIVEVDGNTATDADALIVKTITMEPGDTVRVTYERSGSTATAELTLGPSSS